MTVYNRFDATKNYDRHQFRGDRILQSAELNELQSSFYARLSSIGNTLFKDGDLIREAGCIVDAVTGAVHMQSGALYLAGVVRGIGPASFVIPVVGTVVIGVYLQQRTITEIDDPTLLNPAVGTRGYREPGAERLQINPVWGVAGDGKDGSFYPVYEVVDGILKGKEAPPTIDAVSVAIQKYDRDSTGGNYIIVGMDVRRGEQFSGDKQTYIVSAGSARANGRQITLNAALRYVLSAAPDLKTIESEPHVSAGVAAHRVTVDFGPIASLDEVTITAERQVNVVHGAVSGGADPLPDTSVLQIVSVTQGATTFVKTTDYKLTAGKVDWSPSGAEPATGSAYSVTYQYIKDAEPTAIDSTGFTVAGAVAESLILVSYRYKVPRVDRLCINESGDIVAIKGVASDWMPQPPSVPSTLLLLATLYQQWNSASSLRQDSPRMVPMADLAHVQTQLDAIKMLIATQGLRSDATGRESVLKKSVFVDPLLDDSMRDSGVIQTGAIISGALSLPVHLSAARFGSDVAATTTIGHTVIPLIEQTRKTGSMKVNPYLTFAPIPARIELDPAIDQMTYATDLWTSAMTSRVTQRIAYGGSAGVASSETVETVSSSPTSDQLIRPQTITFTMTGFAAGETVIAASFDGVAVVPGTLADPLILPVANASGSVSGKFNIPANITSGRKIVQIIGSDGSFGSAYFTGASWTENRVLRRVVTEYVYEYDPPPPPTESVSIPQTWVNNDGYIATPSVVQPAPSLVEQMYVTYLGRAGEPAGVDYWNNQLSSGALSMPDLISTFMSSAIENKEQSITSEGAEVWADISVNKCSGVDPLAQTFVAPSSAHLVGVDLWFSAVGSSDVQIHLRATSNGIPTLSILAHSRIHPAQITTDGTATRILFDAPYYVQAEEELAIVVMCNDADAALAIAELGKYDGTDWITAQPYTIGVLLSSSNNRAWTAHQDRDLQFRVLAASYQQAERVIDLGSVAVEAATDLMILGLEEKPGGVSTISYTITLPDATIISAGSNQPLALTAPITGNVHLQAHLRGDSVASPVLHRGGQLLVGWQGANGDYVSRAMLAGADSRVRVIVDALLPSGSSLAVQIKGVDQGDVWSAALPQISATALDEGWFELIYERTDVDENMVQAKISSSGTPAARPFVRNVRVLVM